MTKRKIVKFERRARSTIITLECGHERSIGGHVYDDGQPVEGTHHGIARPFYDCQDGTCYKGKIP